MLDKRRLQIRANIYTNWPTATFASFERRHLSVLRRLHGALKINISLNIRTGYSVTAATSSRRLWCGWNTGLFILWSYIDKRQQLSASWIAPSDLLEKEMRVIFCYVKLLTLRSQVAKTMVPRGLAT